MSWTLRSAVFFGVTTVSLGASAWTIDTDDDNFRPEVIACEEAVLHLVECCPGFTPSAVDCRYLHRHFDAGGCDGAFDEYTRPALSPEESTCIKTMRCDELTAARVCDRARSATPYVDAPDKRIRYPHASPPEEMREAQSHPPVCP
jgi:hypothetical protein